MALLLTVVVLMMNAGLHQPGECLPGNMGLLGVKPEIEAKTNMMGLVAIQVTQGFLALLPRGWR